LIVQVRNVGLGPALDLELVVTSAKHSGRATARISVWRVDEQGTAEISLEGFGQDRRMLTLADFNIAATYSDRTQTGTHHAIMLSDLGIEAERRELARLEAIQTSLYVKLAQQSDVTATEYEYALLVGNEGPGPAWNVILRLLSEENNKGVGSAMSVGNLDGRAEVAVAANVPRPHGPLAGELYWSDATSAGRRSIVQKNLIPAPRR